MFGSEIDYTIHSPRIMDQSDDSSSSRIIDDATVFAPLKSILEDETKEVVSRPKKRALVEISEFNDVEMSPSKLMMWTVANMVACQEKAESRHEELIGALVKSQATFQETVRKDIQQLGALITNKGNAVVRQIKNKINDEHLNEICTNTLLVIMKFGLDFYHNRNFVMPFKYKTGELFIVVSVFPLMVCVLSIS